MAASDPNPPAVLCDEILAEARRESEQIVRGARQQADALLTQAAAEAEKGRGERLDLARAEAARQADMIRATVPVDARRLNLARVETLLATVRDEAHRRLRARVGMDYRATILALAADAVSRMVGTEFVVKLSPADRDLLTDDVAEEIERRVRRSSLKIKIAGEPAIGSGGLIIEDAEARQVWDNRLEVRLERLWPELRRQLAAGAGLVDSGGPTGGGQ